MARYMTTFQEAKDFILTTDTNSNKNISSGSYTFNSAAVSVPSGSYIQRSYSVPLSQVTRRYQIYTNLSFQPGLYYPASRFEAQDPLNSSWRYGVQITTSGTNTLSLIVYLVNNDVSSHLFPAFDVNVVRRDFLDEL